MTTAHRAENAKVTDLGSLAAGNLAGRQVLVTGATGAIGRQLVAALLDADAQVRILTRSCQAAQQLGREGRVTCQVGDLLEPSTLNGALHGIELVFHLASYSPSAHEVAGDEALGHWAVTVDGTGHLVAEATRAGVRRILFASSIKAMGEVIGTAIEPADEDSPTRPSTRYGRAKRVAEQHLLNKGRTRDLEAVVLRLAMVYGPGMGENIQRLIAAIARGRFPPWPRIEQRRSAVHSNDVIQALLLAATSPRAIGRVYLVTDGQPYSTRQLYEVICKALGRPIPSWALPLWLLQGGAAIGSLGERLTQQSMPLSRASLTKLTGNAWASSARIEQELGFRSSMTLEAAIPEMVQDALGRI